MNLPQTPLAIVVQTYEDRIKTRFSPTKTLYDATGIGRKRFAQLLRGEKSPTTDEIKPLAEFFGVPITDLI